ncbi:MAG TPA: barstar family protein [Verrucomicrobiota bacterium]|nr:barstar family protein [Verrucomicrobiota bacterium]
MAAFDAFTFIEPGATPTEADSLVAVVPRGIADAKQLLEVLYQRLNLPGYFGFNWDALSDCLRDFHWVKQRNVVLIHEDLPTLTSTDLVNYVEVLEECVRSWKPNENHRLVVMFPESCRERIERVADGKA